MTPVPASASPTCCSDAGSYDSKMTPGSLHATIVNTHVVATTEMINAICSPVDKSSLLCSCGTNSTSTLRQTLWTLPNK